MKTMEKPKKMIISLTFLSAYTQYIYNQYLALPV
jgi:hypothetical protein